MNASVSRESIYAVMTERFMALDPTEPFCVLDECPVSICCGPHWCTETTLGIEIMKLWESPIGKPLPMSYDVPLIYGYPLRYPR